MAITLEQVEELTKVGGLTEEALELIMNGEIAYIDSIAPEAEDNNLRDSIIVDLIKLRLAFNGYSSMMLGNFSGSYTNKRLCIVKPLLPLDAVDYDDD